jgi:hypothetical protein
VFNDAGGVPRLAMLGQMRLGYLQQLRSRKRVEKIHRIDASNDGSLMLLIGKLGITIARDWPRGRERMLLGNNILPTNLRGQSSCMFSIL